MNQSKTKDPYAYNEMDNLHGDKRHNREDRDITRALGIGNMIQNSNMLCGECGKVFKDSRKDLFNVPSGSVIGNCPHCHAESSLVNFGRRARIPKRKSEKFKRFMKGQQ